MSRGAERAVPMLAVRGLSKTFTVRDGLKTRRFDAVADVSFDLARGEALALVGESGSGKSTIARLIARLLPATRGGALLDGREILGSRPVAGFRGRVQMIFQDPFASLNPVHTVGYHLARPLLIHRRVAGRAEAQAAARDLLETVGLAPASEFELKHPHEMSGGQRQRVAIARALAVGPELVLADEPTSMLDVSIRVDILNLLKRLKEERGLGFLYITHDLASARYFAERILVLYAGRVVEEGRSDELIDGPLHPYTRLLLAAAPGSGARLEGLARGAAIPGDGGCAFRARCPLAEDRCRAAMPELVDAGGGRRVRCLVR